MKEATNITPIETVEEGFYNFMAMFSVSGFVSSSLLLVHLFLVHSVFSYLFASVATLSIVGYFFVSWLKRKRFGDKNLTLAERIVRVEGALGISVAS